MAINKTINKSTKSHGAMRNCIEYVLREDKTNRGLVYVTGPFSADEITYDSVYQSFLEEKKLWEKDSGRMYAHNIISWHKEENLTLQQAFAFGKEFVEKWFDGFQTLIGVHKDRDHVHLHLVTNTVSYEDGHKLHNSKKDLERMKELTNEMCVEHGLTVAQKGKDFHGNDLEEGHVRAWSKDKYHLLLNDQKKSHVAECALAVMETREQSCSKEEFVKGMAIRGWRTAWTDSRKNITFENEEGKKVRDSNISKTFQMDVSKEGLLNEFERQAEIRERVARRKRANSGEFQLDEEIRSAESEFEEYYREVKAVIAGSATGTSNNDSGEGRFAQDSGRGQEIIQGRIREATDFKSEFGERKENFDGERISLKERLGVCQKEAGKREEERKLDEQTHTRTRGRSR
ncbi:relaxase/mobilization nuclease domain-containing protein [Lachnospiraceae bacterium LCP25S3_G4]